MDGDDPRKAEVLRLFEGAAKPKRDTSKSNDRGLQVSGTGNFVAGRDLNINAAGPALHASGITREMLEVRRQDLVSQFNANKRQYWANPYFFWMLAGWVATAFVFQHYVMGAVTLRAIRYEVLMAFAFGGIIVPSCCLSVRHAKIDSRVRTLRLQVQAIDQALATMP